jgi:hypothetical protein
MEMIRTTLASLTVRSLMSIAALTAALLAVPTLASGAVLYDQTDNATSGNHGSNDWMAPNVGFDDQLADDFTVPGGQSWQLSQLDVLGVGGDASPTVNVFIYTSAGTLPGAELFHQSVTATSEPDYSAALTGTPSLMPGTYWISLQQAGTHAGTAWYWRERSVQTGNPAAYRNPGGSGTPACADWGVRATCLSGASTPDELFKLTGTATPTPTPNGSSATGQRAAALKKCKKRAHKQHWPHNRLKRCKKKARLLPV